MFLLPFKEETYNGTKYINYKLNYEVNVAVY